MPLTNATLHNLTTPGRHADGGGLYLQVISTGGRYWRVKYRYRGLAKNTTCAFTALTLANLYISRQRLTA